jgi:hypothetical protein
MGDLEAGARKILSHLEAVYVPTHNYVAVSPRDFRHLDLKFYDSVKASLEKLGFRHVSDEEDTTISAAPGGLMRRVMIRSMLSSDGIVMAGAYHPRIKFPWRVLLFILRQKVPPKTVDLETEFENGAFLGTTNVGEAAAAMTQPPMILLAHFPEQSPVEAMLAAHLERVRAYAEMQGVQPRSFSSREDIIASQNRMSALKSLYRNEIGGVTAEELAKLSSGHLDVAARMHEKISELRARSADSS